MKPLEGITVLELSTMITASFAAMMMAEQGARVIKIETLDTGDPMRYLGSSKGGISALFANCNRGKESIQVDLKTADGQQLIRRMTQTADILIHNFRPGVMDKLNLGSDELRKANPRLIYTAISGFGTAGPMSGAPAYDPIIQAQAGFTATQARDPATPEFVRNLMCDKVTAYTACQAVTAALYVREKTDEGQHIDLSMLDAGLFFLFPDGFMHHTLLDADAEHRPPLSELIYDLTRTCDGGVILSASTEAQRVGALIAVDLVHLFADERFNSPEKLEENQVEFLAIVADACLKMTTDELLAKLHENDVPAAKCLSHEEVLGHAQFLSNETLDAVEHPVMGNMRIIKAPAQFAGERLAPANHSPALGEHTGAVLREFGVSDEQANRWRGEGVIV